MNPRKRGDGNCASRKGVASLRRAGSADFLNLEIILIRHGETQFNRIGRIQGSLDSLLTSRGRAEAERLGASLANWLGTPDLWLVSPQGRARESSRLIRESLLAARGGASSSTSGSLLPEESVEENAREISCGSCEGRPIQELDPELLHSLRTRADCPYPGGESILDVMERGRPVVARILAEARSRPYADPPNRAFRAVLVSHGNFLRCFAAVVSGLGAEFALRSIKSNTGLSRLISRDAGGTFKILTWNDVSHSHGMEEEFSNLGTG